jgi:hypothetical protein
MSKNSDANKLSKSGYMQIERERDMLKITLNHLAAENSKLKTSLNDMKITVKHNKNLLKEYIETITNKDKVVEKMSSTISSLQIRLETFENYLKKM